MKKSLLGLLLAAALVVPAFAAKGDTYINAKLGLGVNSNVAVSGAMITGNDDEFYELKTDMPFMLGAEFFYGTSDNFSIGFGANYVFDADSKALSKYGGGTTNIYVAIKPEAKIESNIFTSLYLIGQFGLSFGRTDSDIEGDALSIDRGLYLGAGFGVTIKDAVFVELIFSSCNGKLKADGIQLGDIQYNITSVNVGYKFNI